MLVCARANQDKLATNYAGARSHIQVTIVIYIHEGSRTLRSDVDECVSLGLEINLHIVGKIDSFEAQLQTKTQGQKPSEHYGGVMVCRI
jgi:predicted DNA-binding ArsR family transcriptional regulator